VQVQARSTSPLRQRHEIQGGQISMAQVIGALEKT
jgi:hypothetical protein